MRLSIYFNLKTRIIDSYHIWENNEEVNIHEDEALLELDDATFVKIQPFKTKYINGELDFSENDTEELKKAIRFYRNINCFDIVNRGQVWYNTLTESQKQELQTWYQGWLDAPETLIIPEKPSWL